MSRTTDTGARERLRGAQQLPRPRAGAGARLLGCMGLGKGGVRRCVEGAGGGESGLPSALVGQEEPTAALRNQTCLRSGGSRWPGAGVRARRGGAAGEGIRADGEATMVRRLVPSVD